MDTLSRELGLRVYLLCGNPVALSIKRIYRFAHHLQILCKRIYVTIKMATTSGAVWQGPDPTDATKLLCSITELASN